MSFLSGIPTVAKVVLPITAGAALAGAIAWGASGGGAGQSGPPVAPTGVAAAPTAGPEKTPGPLPWDPARPDCPQGWRAYNDPDGYFSICHEPGLARSAPERVAGPSEGATFGVADPQGNANSNATNVFSLNIAWRSTLRLGAGPPSPSNCQRYISVPNTTSTGFVQMTLSGRQAAGCLSKGPFKTQPPIEIDQLDLWVPLAADGSGSAGYITVSVGYIGPDLSGTFKRAQQVLDTLKLR